MTDGTLTSLRITLSGRYEILRELARGGMGQVFEARDLRHDRPVAIKVLDPEVSAAIGPSRFRREIEFAARLSHPHIVPLFDSGEADGLLYYVMPLIVGESLRQRLLQERQLPVDEAIAIARNVADALRYAHERGLVHRDVKPENIILSEGHALVLDFGIARSSDAAPNADTRTLVAIGTPPYMSPEQISVASTDGRADQYALACVVYEMLAGRPPFTGPTGESVLKQHFAADPRPVTALRPDAPASVAQALTRALAKAPEDRYPTMAAFSEALGAAPAPAAAAVALEAADAPPSKPRLRPWMVATAGLVGVIAVALSLFVKLTPGTPPASAQQRLMVVPFDFHGPAADAYLGEGVASLLSTALDGVDSLKSLELRYVTSVAHRNQIDMGNPEDIAKLARKLGAGLVVTGDLVVTGNRARVTTHLTRVSASGARSESGRVIESSLDSLTELSDLIARDVVATHLSGMGDELEATAARTTRSVGALRHYLRAQRAIAQGSDPSVVAASLRDAINADTRFALAWARLAGIQAGQLRFDECRASITRAVETADRLAPRDRLSLEASRAYYFGDADGSENLTRQLLADYPDDPDLWQRLAATFVAYNSLRGRSISEALGPLEKAEELGIKREEIQANLLNATLAARKPSLVQDLVARGPTSGGYGGGPSMMSILNRLAKRDQASAGVLRNEMRSMDYWQLMASAYWLKAGRDPQLAIEFARAAASPRFNADERAAALVHVALLSIARGQRHAALDALREARSLRPQEGTAYATVVSLSAGALTDDGTLQDDLVRIDGLPEVQEPLVSEGVDSDVAGTEGSVALARLALRAMILARLGLASRVESACEELRTFPGTDLERRWAGYYAASARATLAWSRHDPRATLAFLEAAPLVGQTGGRKALRSNQNERFLRGEALRALGRDEEALGWYRGLNQLFWWDTSYATIGALRCAELSEKLGQRENALAYYREVLENLADCDPDYLSWRRQAESGVERLGALASAATP